MKKIFTLVALMLVCIGQMCAYDFEVGGIYYNITFEGAAEVSDVDDLYSGDVVIPTIVTYKGETYSVTSIGYSAFSGCSGLTSVTVEGGNTHYDSRDNCNAIIAFYRSQGLDLIEY